MTTNEIERLNYLESHLEQLRIENLMLSRILSGILHGLPLDLAQDVAESVRMALEDEASRLAYEDHPLADFFHESTEQFFIPNR